LRASAWMRGLGAIFQWKGGSFFRTKSPDEAAGCFGNSTLWAE
jgi:hypothetical protein